MRGAEAWRRLDLSVKRPWWLPPAGRGITYEQGMFPGERVPYPEALDHVGSWRRRWAYQQVGERVIVPRGMAEVWELGGGS
jgi:hypothetical protein